MAQNGARRRDDWLTIGRPQEIASGREI